MVIIDLVFRHLISREMFIFKYGSLIHYIIDHSVGFIFCVNLLKFTGIS